MIRTVFFAVVALFVTTSPTGSVPATCDAAVAAAMKNFPPLARPATPEASAAWHLQWVLEERRLEDQLCEKTARETVMQRLPYKPGEKPRN